MTRHDRPADHLRHGRRDRLLRELEHDPYHAKEKIGGTARCPTCGAVYLEGRWTWKPPESGTALHVCPACQRVADGVPAAFLTLSGAFVSEHAAEITHLIRNYEQRERAEHPLKRIMAERPTDRGLEFTFTDAHLARGIGEALHHAYQGELDYHYQKGEVLLRVDWTRDG